MKLRSVGVLIWVLCTLSADQTSASDAELDKLKGLTTHQVTERLGEPKKIARQILLGRHSEQWTYDQPSALHIEFRGVRGQEAQVVSVHSLRSKKPE
jgi:hypothetical protein